MSFKVDDWVLVSTKNLRQKRPSRKLSQKFLGPYQVDKVVGMHGLAYKLYILVFMRLHLVFPISALEPFYGRPGEDPSTLQELYVQGNNVYEVEAILNYKGNGRNRQFYIKWKDYEDEENTWEPRRNVFAKELLADYEARLGLLR